MKFLGGNKKFLKSRAPRLLLDGPRGTGKTLAVLYKCHSWAMLYPGCKILWMRATKSDLADNAMLQFETEVAPGMFSVMNRNHRALYQYPNGSQIFLKAANLPSKIQGGEVDFQVYFEASQLDESWVISNMATCRGGMSPYRQIIYECNPTSPNCYLMNWVRKGDVKRFKSSHPDNPRYHNDKSYKEEYVEGYLKTLPEPLRSQWYSGRWVAAEGLCIGNYLDAISEFNIDAIDGEQVIGLDFGWTHPMGCVWAKIDADDCIWIYNSSKTKQAQAFNVLKGYEDNLIIADAARPDEISNLYNNGFSGVVKCKKGVDSVVNGIYAVSSAIQRGKLRIHPSCVDLIDELANYRWDMTKSRQAPIKLNDDVVDALRYLVMHYSRVISYGIEDKPTSIPMQI